MRSRGRRRFVDDPTYGIEHFERFPEQYKRIEHRFKLADIDWIEFCGYCYKPITNVEMFRDSERGHDLSDKGVSVTRRMAHGVGIDAYVMAYWVPRPAEVQQEIDQLGSRILELARQYPIQRCRAQRIEPQPRSRVETYSPERWWELVALWHSTHHQRCLKAQSSSEKLANPEWMKHAQGSHSGLWVPPQEPLWEDPAA